MPSKCIRSGRRCGHRGCVHSTTNTGMCCYYLDTGERRNSPPGAKCDKYTPLSREEVPKIDLERIYSNAE